MWRLMRSSAVRLLQRGRVVTSVDAFLVVQKGVERKNARIDKHGNLPTTQTTILDRIIKMLIPN